MRRTDLQTLAAAKLADGQMLLEHGRWSNAYYLSGYSVELGLKACIARQISADTIPDKAILKDVLSHEFLKLIGLAGLRAELRDQQNADAEFAANWAISTEWSPDARYRACSAMEAQYLVRAIADPQHGVLPWIRTYW